VFISGRCQQQWLRAVCRLLSRVQPSFGAGAQQLCARPAVLSHVRQPLRVARVASHDAAPADGDDIPSEQGVLSSAAAAATLVQRNRWPERQRRATYAQLELAAVHPGSWNAQAGQHPGHARIIQAGQ